MSELLEQEEKEFSFLKEKIKKKPFDKKKIFIYSGTSILLAILFGITASFVFVVANPYMEKWFSTSDSTVEIPQDEVADDTKTTDQETTDDTDSSTSGETSQIIVNNTKELEISDYTGISDKLYEIGKKVNKSIVTVTGVTSEKDLLNATYESEGKACGVIIAQTDNTLYILTDKSELQDADIIEITFMNNATVQGNMVESDENTGLMVISVPLSKIDSLTMEKISVVSLGNSYKVNQGDVVLALGNYNKYNFSISQGLLTSINNAVSTVDMEYTVFTTDLVSSNIGNGILVNTSGEVVAIFMQDYLEQTQASTIIGISVSELKPLINKLTNNQKIPYLGIKGKGLTDEEVSKYNLTKGYYVSSLNFESPSIKAGIQSGDVIVSFDDEIITNTADYENALMKCSVGEIVKVKVIRRGQNNEKNEIVCNAIVGVMPEE